jgi:AcrR family transcriptional regulator
LEGQSFRRDAERSRQAILDAAEDLFADPGYEAVSMQRIGHAAGLSRGAPGYFFGSKESLYRAVVERMFEGIEQMVDVTRHQLAAVGAQDHDRALEIVVGNLLEFLYQRPTYLVLVERETLRRSGVMQGTRAHLSLLRAAVSIADNFEQASFLVDSRQVLLSLLGLCWFPLANPPLLRELGGQLDRDFLEARKRHVVALLRAGLRRGA